MSLVTILPLVLIVGVMFMMTRSAKNKQRQAQNMRSEMEPGTGVRTIGGMYAVVKEVNDETVLLELTDGVHAHFAKNAIGAVLSEDEFNRIVHGIEPEEPADAEDSAEPGEITADATDATTGDVQNVDLTKDAKESEDGTSPEQDGSDAKPGSKPDSK